MSLNFDAPISYTRYLDFGEELKILNGSPISLLKLPIVDEESLSVDAIILVVVVFPLLPVIAITFPS
tara:strand:+ start:583 stop:783 length:201 start_codon:yes stop_codon:yes gene_type:complete